MDVGRAINYAFQDSEWVKKVAIGGVLLLVPIVGWFIVLGYFMRNIRQVATGPDLPLPEWNDFGGDLVRGLKGWVAGLVWALPLVVISACVLAPLSSLNNNNAGLGILWLGGWCVNSILGIAVGFMLPLVISRVAMTESISSALDFTAVINEARQAAVPLLISLVVSAVVGFVAEFGLILCLVGVVFTLFLAYLITSHLYGQIRRQLDLGTPTSTVVPARPTF